VGEWFTWRLFLIDWRPSRRLQVGSTQSRAAPSCHGAGRKLPGGAREEEDRAGGAGKRHGGGTQETEGTDTGQACAAKGKAMVMTVIDRSQNRKNMEMWQRLGKAILGLNSFHVGFKLKSLT